MLRRIAATLLAVGLTATAAHAQKSADTLRAWATHPDHIAVKKRGRQDFYMRYHLQVCELLRESRFNADSEPA